MSLNLTQFGGAFKDVYHEGSDVFKEQQNIHAPFLDKIKTAAEKPSPDGIFTPTVMQFDFSGGAQNEDGTFDDYVGDLPIKPKIVSKLLTYYFEVTGSTIRLSKTDKQAFGRAMDRVMKNRYAVAFYDMERQWMGTGTGQISLANGSGSAATSLIVDDPTGFRVGMYIESFATLGGSKEIGVSNACRITAINLSTNTLTITPAQTWSDNSIICKKGKLDGVTSLANAKEMMGIQGMVDVSTYSTTFESVDTTTYAQFTGNVVSAGTAPISHDFLQRVHNRVAIVSNSEPNMLLSNYGQARNFLNTELQKTRYEPGEVKAGATVLKWGKYEWMINNNCAQGVVFFLNMDEVSKYQTDALKLADLPNYSLFQVQNKDAVGGYLVYQGNGGTWARNRHGKGTDLTEPTY